MPKTAIKIGPDDDGRRMSLEEFSQAEGQEGYLYELDRGVVVVTDIPKLRHMAQVLASRRQLSAFDLSNPGRIYAIASGSECKILLRVLGSERHPDLAVYRSVPPAVEEDELWALWVPDITLEIVSPGSEHRDYVEKAEEYLLFGVREYWIIDEGRGEMRVLRRRGDRWNERTVRPGEIYRTRLLPGFEFDVAAVFEAARASEK
jgi:Uma2 family endonuclease